ncbi:lysylphosphatidylglycerol synthase transmembrane domain-containing protein [Magnetococcales bacterium HHB-1]
MDKQAKSGATRQWLFQLLKWTVAVAIVYYLVSQGKLDWNSATELSLGLIVSLLIIHNLISLVLALRWRLLLTCQGIDFPAIKAIQVTYIGLFFNNFLPGGILGGDAIRMGYVVLASPGRRGAAALSVFFDRVFGFFSLLVLATLAIFYNSEAILKHDALISLSIILILLVLAIPVGFMLAAILPQRPAIKKRLQREDANFLIRVLRTLADALHIFRKSPKTVFQVIGISLLCQAAIVGTLLMIAHAMGFFQLIFTDYLFVSSWTWVANMVPLSPGGLGIGEAVFDQLCHWIDPMATLVPYGTAYLSLRILLSVSTLPGFLVYLFYRNEVQSIMKTS